MDGSHCIHLCQVAHLDFRVLSEDFDTRQAFSDIVGLQHRTAISNRQNGRATAVCNVIPPRCHLQKFTFKREPAKKSLVIQNCFWTAEVISSFPIVTRLYDSLYSISRSWIPSQTGGFIGCLCTKVLPPTKTRPASPKPRMLLSSTRPAAFTKTKPQRALETSVDASQRL